MLKEIPSYSIITSRLSRVEIKDIINIVYSLDIKGAEAINTREYIVGVGVSNNEELDQLKYMRELPIIHIQKECQSLIRIEKKKTIKEHIKNRLYFQLFQPLVWILYSSKMKQCLNQMKRGKEVTEYRVFQKSTIPIPNYVLVLFTLSSATLLSYFTKKFIHNSRRKQYQYIKRNDEFFLVRNDVFYGRLHYYLYYFVFPYSFFGLLYSTFKYKHIKN